MPFGSKAGSMLPSPTASTVLARGMSSLSLIDNRETEASNMLPQARGKESVFHNFSFSTTLEDRTNLSPVSAEQNGFAGEKQATLAKVLEC